MRELYQLFEGNAIVRAVGGVKVVANELGGSVKINAPVTIKPHHELF
jgi:hypothetical protein